MEEALKIIIGLILVCLYTWFVSKWMYKKGHDDYMQKDMQRHDVENGFTCVDQEVNKSVNSSHPDEGWTGPWTKK